MGRSVHSDMGLIIMVLPPAVFAAATALRGSGGSSASSDMAS